MSSRWKLRHVNNILTCISLIICTVTKWKYLCNNGKIHAVLWLSTKESWRMCSKECNRHQRPSTVHEPHDKGNFNGRTGLQEFHGKFLWQELWKCKIWTIDQVVMHSIFQQVKCNFQTFTTGIQIISVALNKICKWISQEIKENIPDDKQTNPDWGVLDDRK